MYYIPCHFSLAQLEGVNEPVVLQIFVGNDTGRVKPHGFYQACRVTGRNTTACKEVVIDGTTVIEVSLDPSSNMTLAYVLFFRLKLDNCVIIYCIKCVALCTQVYLEDYSIEYSIKQLFSGDVSYNKVKYTV